MALFAGVYAALLTPRTEDGDLDLASYGQQLRSLDEVGSLAGYAINGATGEFNFSTEAELAMLLEVTRETSPRAQFLCGIGAGDLRGTIRRGRLAAVHGAKAALLPMPSFFPYRQDDLIAYAGVVASELELPILLYNLPRFTTGLEVDTVLSLLSTHPNLAGIKDSSGSLDLVRAITAAGLSSARLIGNDSALAPALREGVCDGVVSGVACTLPELMTSLFVATPDDLAFRNVEKLLDDFISQIGVLPTPWGLKVTSAARSFTREGHPLPLSPRRQGEIATLRSWFLNWYEQTLRTPASAA